MKYPHLKINSDNMKFYLFEVHEYMDMYPTEEIMVFDNQEDAIKWAQEMNRSYSGGTTTFKKEMTDKEAAEYLAKEFKAALLDRKWPDDIAVEEAMKVASKNNIELFIRCYGRKSNLK